MLPVEATAKPAERTEDVIPEHFGAYAALQQVLHSFRLCGLDYFEVGGEG